MRRTRSSGYLKPSNTSSRSNISHLSQHNLRVQLNRGSNRGISTFEHVSSHQYISNNQVPSRTLSKRANRSIKSLNRHNTNSNISKNISTSSCTHQALSNHESPSSSFVSTMAPKGSRFDNNASKKSHISSSVRKINPSTQYRSLGTDSHTQTVDTHCNTSPSVPISSIITHSSNNDPDNQYIPPEYAHYTPPPSLSDPPMTSWPQYYPSKTTPLGHHTSTHDFTSERERTHSFYRRVMSDQVVHFNSSTGRQYFKEALLDNTLEPFFPLSEQFSTQSEPSYCGLTTLSMCLNAFAVDPQQQWRKPWRWYADDLLACCRPLRDIKIDGMTYSQFGSLARCHGLDVEERPYNTTSIDTFRDDIIRICSQSSIVNDGYASSSVSLNRGGLKQVIVACFSRQTLGQTGDGHLSPLAGYHAGSDSVLLLDVARFKYPPYWLPLPLLWSSFSPIDSLSGKSRGYFILEPIYNTISTLDCNNIMNNSHNIMTHTMTKKDIILNSNSSNNNSIGNNTSNILQVHSIIPNNIQLNGKNNNGATTITTTTTTITSDGSIDKSHTAATVQSSSSSSQIHNNQRYHHEKINHAFNAAAPEKSLNLSSWAPLGTSLCTTSSSHVSSSSSASSRNNNNNQTAVTTTTSTSTPLTSSSPSNTTITTSSTSTNGCPTKIKSWSRKVIAPQVQVGRSLAQNALNIRM